MVSDRSWTIEQWATRMFADPLRAALARRLVWRFESDGDATSATRSASPNGRPQHRSAESSSSRLTIRSAVIERDLAAESGILDEMRRDSW